MGGGTRKNSSIALRSSLEPVTSSDVRAGARQLSRRNESAVLVSTTLMPEDPFSPSHGNSRWNSGPGTRFVMRSRSPYAASNGFRQRADFPEPGGPRTSIVWGPLRAKNWLSSVRKRTAESLSAPGGTQSGLCQMRKPSIVS